MSNTLNCFVAMAFGHHDTQVLYDRSIQPTIRHAKIIPRCVMRIEHNDDLNNRIIHELRRADLVIADLTYARPSVYYEAGFAERSVPVIYTCSAGHLKPRSDDPNGNLRVHFDLQMKNIITWRNPDDSSFRKRLLRRINYLARPLKAKQAQSQKEARDSTAFSILPIRSRLDHLERSANRILAQVGFVRLKPVEGMTFPIMASTRRSGRLVLATIYVGSQFHKSRLRDIIANYYRLRPDLLKSSGYLKEPGRKPAIREKLMICSLGRLSFSTLREQAPSAFLGELPNSLTLSGTIHVPPERYDSGWGKDFDTLVEMHVLDKIPFVQRFKNDLLVRLTDDFPANGA